MRMIQPKLKMERSKNWYWRRMLPKPAFILIIILASVILVLTFWRVEFAFALLGVVLSVWTAYHAKVSHFLECFSRCNKSYSDVNGLLPHLPSPRQDHEHPGPKDDPYDAIVDYFNLCAEEYLMHKMGVIPDFVWDVWRAGIHNRALHNDIKAAWVREKEANCDDYYGFDLGKIVREHHEAHWHQCKNRTNCPFEGDASWKSPEEESGVLGSAYGRPSPKTSVCQWA
jgi:hypothetical protein